MELSNVNKRDIVSGLALGAAGVAFARHIIPASRWNTTLLCGGVLLGTGTAFALETRMGGRHASAIACGGLAAVIMGYAANELMDQPHKMLTAWREGDLWSAIAGVRRLSVATGMAIPAAWGCWKLADGLLQDKVESRDTRFFAGSIWNAGSLIIPYSDLKIEVWLRADSMAADHNRKHGENIIGADVLWTNGIPIDITEDCSRMTAEQIEGLIIKTTDEKLPIAHLTQRLKEQGRGWIVERMIQRGKTAASVLTNDTWDGLLEAYNNRDAGNVKELKERLSKLAAARATASLMFKRFSHSSGIENDLLPGWEELPKQISGMGQTLEDIPTEEDEDLDEDAAYVLQMKMTNDVDKWKDALGIDDLSAMGGVLKAKGMETRADLIKHGILDDPNPDVICQKLKNHRSPEASGVKAALLNYLSTPSALKESMGPTGRKALKVIGALGYVGVWALCTVAHYKHHKGWFYAGGAAAIVERIIWKREMRIRDMPNLHKHNHSWQAALLILGLQAAMLGEEMQATWLAGNDVQQVLRGDESIRRDLYERAVTFGERGPVAQTRVLASETGLSGLYSAVNWVATPSSIRSQGEIAVGTLVVGRSFTHMMCDTAVGLFNRGKRYVATWGQPAGGEGAE